MKAAGICGAVTEERKHNFACFFVFFGQGGADRRGLVASDYAGRTEIIAFGNLGNVHGTASALAIDGFFAHQLGHHLVPVALTLFFAVRVFVADSSTVTVAPVSRADHVSPPDG